MNKTSILDWLKHVKDTYRKNDQENEPTNASSSPLVIDLKYRNPFTAEDYGLSTQRGRIAVYRQGGGTITGE